jgi:hypothetical protein
MKYCLTNSFPRLIPAHLGGPGLCFAKPLFGLAKRRKQPERYVQCAGSTTAVKMKKNKK